MKRPTKSVVIAGLPRCGTTLLATFLASRPRVSFLTDYVTCFNEAALHLGVQDWRAPLDDTQRRVALAIVRDQLLRFRHPVLVGVDGFLSLRGLHEAVLAELMRPGDVAVGHKLLLTAHQVERLLEETDTHVVVMYRDARDAALSFFHRTGRGVEHYLEGWRRMARLVVASRHPRLFPIHYESLVSSPQVALTPLFRALDLELDTRHAGLVFDRGPAGSVAWTGNSSLGTPSRAFDRHAVARWRTAIDSPIVRYAGVTCRRELQELGYPSGPGIALAERYRWQLHRAAHLLSRAADERWEATRARFLDLIAPALRP